MKKTERTATGGIAEELRKMEVGDVVNFPIPKYNYNSIRTAPGTTLVKEKLDGYKYKHSVDFDKKCVVVTRIS